VLNFKGYFMKNTPLSSHTTSLLCVVLFSFALSACESSAPQLQSSKTTTATAGSTASGNADQFLPIDCLLKGQVRKLGGATYVTARHPIRTTAVDCEIRGGEYTSYNRSDYKTALTVWLPKAKENNAEAQNYVGQIYEKGKGVKPDYTMAFQWYQRAAEQNYSRAQINLGNLYEKGLGVTKNPEKALEWYRKASGLQQELELNSASLNGPRIAATAATTTAPAGLKRQIAAPTLELIDPNIQRTRSSTTPVVTLRSLGNTRKVIGRVTAPAGLLSLQINRQDQTKIINKFGVFQAEVAVAETKTPVTITAIDHQGKRAEVSFIFKTQQTPTPSAQPIIEAPQASPIPSLSYGNYYALVIGNNNYNKIPKLKTAVNDARTLAGVLTERYGFKTHLLIDANRYQILSSLNQMRSRLTNRDNLLIYYAGHGVLVKENMRGHWLPVDAEKNNTANWISNTALTDTLNLMKTKHILVISDSCYSGSLTRTLIPQLQAGKTDTERTHFLRTLLKQQSRTALTSGGLKPVLDGGGNGHSVFTNALLAVLKTNTDALEGSRLFNQLAAKVAFAASEKKFEQIPEYAPIRHSGHEGGDFILVPRS
jgi:hypothetical protein